MSGEGFIEAGCGLRCILFILAFAATIKTAAEVIS